MKFMKLGSKPDSFQSDGNIRYVGSDLATDIVINVGEAKFYLHKFPLLTKSSLLQKLLSSSNNKNSGEIELHEIPGGSNVFETCAKFCYGITVTLNAHSVVGVRCAAEYLEMHENVEKGNFVYKLDVFLNSCLFRGWKDSIAVLQTTKLFLPLTEELKLTARCIEAIASMASVDPSEVGWSYTYSHRKISDENGVRNRIVPNDWWVEDLCEVDVDLYRRVFVAIKNRGTIANKVMGEALKAYAYSKLPGYGKKAVPSNDVPNLRSIVETIAWLLPEEKGCVSVSFLIKLLKAVVSVGSGETVRAALVKRIGQQLEEASLNDLLIRAQDDEGMTYDVQIVQEMLEGFRARGHELTENRGEIEESCGPTILLTEASKLMVVKLVDSYLADIAKDPNLPLASFTCIADMVSSFPRPSHDGLYRAIDTYLKEHPGISKAERKRICRLMDCKKLSAEACMHAVQNERLPLRVVVQVLFFEQVRAAAATSGSSTPDLPGAIKDLNYASSRSTTTNNDEEWDNVASAEELSALRGDLAALRLSGGCGAVSGDRANGESRPSNEDKDGVGKVKGLIMPKRIFSKIWSGKRGENHSGSDSSESHEEGSGGGSRLTLVRRGRS